ncbi:hypothetical protein ACUN9Y_03215 [Halomonas sp. V046]|uniref:hypothetical protein n=1 Tax=Halomonas sp. V046 TaxID=3459611 RepID=UPI004044FE3B
MIKIFAVTGVCALFTAICPHALAQDTSSLRSLPHPGPSVGARSLINLGNAGLLQPFFSNQKFGAAQARMGSARFAYGAHSSDPQKVDFREDSNILITPVNLMLELPSSVGASYLRINGARTASDSSPHSLELEGELYHGEIEFLHLPNENVMWGVGVVANNFESEDQISGTEVIRDSLGLRVDYLHKFSDHWGMAARGLYVWGETENRVYDIPTRYGTSELRKKQGDDRYYLQADVVGSWFGNDTSWLPQGTLAHPRIGALYHHSSLSPTSPQLGNIELPKETGVNGADEEFGLAWAHFRLQKAPQPTPGLQWLPSATLGVEYEYENALDELNNEDTYAVLGAGITATMQGHGVFLDYKRYQGLQGDRENNVLVAGVTLSF